MGLSACLFRALAYCQLNAGKGGFMAIKTIALRRLETDLERTLKECPWSGETVVAEMPNQRLLAIQPLEPQEDHCLMNEVPAFNARIAFGAPFGVTQHAAMLDPKRRNDQLALRDLGTGRE
jgi:hypothetical protein